MGFQKQSKTKILICLITISLFTLKPASAESNTKDFIKKSCKASQFPDLCYTSLAPFGDQVQQSPEKLALVSITFFLSKVEPIKSHVENVYRKSFEPNLSQRLKYCVENFGIMVDNIKEAIKQFKDIGVPKAISDVRAHMSKVLYYEDTCVDVMKGAPNGPEKKDVINRTAGVTKFTSISLAMIDLFAKS